jgi:hypothetical protein
MAKVTINARLPEPRAELIYDKEAEKFKVVVSDEVRHDFWAHILFTQAALDKAIEEANQP